MEFTGSSYTGQSAHNRMEGKGEYTFASGTRYVGEMKDGMFHGEGTLYFPNGGKVASVWKEGRAVGEGVGGEYTFSDGLKYNEDGWDYCNAFSERRFYTEMCKGLKPAGRSQLIDSETQPHVIPLGWFDVGDGMYNPETRRVESYTGGFLRNADDEEHLWIITHCRKGVSDDVA